MSNKSDKKASIIEFLSVKASLPSDALTGDFRLEIRGRNSVIVCGCRRIQKYTPTEMVLSAKDFDVSVVGERLICTAYHEGAICIEGYVTDVKFDSENTEGAEA